MHTIAPATPAITGTHYLSRQLDYKYSIGRDYVPQAVWRLASEPVLAVDIETFGLGLDARKIKCVTFGNERECVILDPRDPMQAELVRSLIFGNVELVFHRSCYDVPNLVINNLMRISDCNKVVDTLIYCRFWEPSEYTQKSVEWMAAFLGLDPTGVTMKQVFKETGFKISDGWREFDINRASYIWGAAWDVLVTARSLPLVREAAITRLSSEHPFKRHGLTSAEDARALVEREQTINRMTLRRTAKGIRIDDEFLNDYMINQGEELAGAEKVLATAGVGPNKAAQLTAFLDGVGALPEDYPTTATGKWSTTKGHLERLRHPVAQAYVRHKEIEHIRNDYLIKCRELAVGGRVFPEVNILKATTGRMSYGNPPFHQFPAPARGIVLADEGDELTSLDWAQIEPCLACNLSGDLSALEAYEDGTGDMYSIITSHVPITRKVAKVVLLAQLYGEGLYKLSEDLGIELEEARDIRDHIFTVLPRTKRMLYQTKDIAERYRRIVTISGRILPIPAGRGGLGVQVHKGPNYRIQGGAYDILAESLYAAELAGLGDAIYITMHDEIVCSTGAADEIQAIMARPPQRLIEISGRVPVLRTDRADLGGRWAAT